MTIYLQLRRMVRSIGEARRMARDVNAWWKRYVAEANEAPNPLQW